MVTISPSHARAFPSSASLRQRRADAPSAVRAACDLAAVIARRRTGVRLLVAAALAAALVCAGLLVVQRSPDRSPSGDGSVAPVDFGKVVTAVVERRRLIDDVTVRGTVHLGVSRDRAFDCDEANASVTTSVASGGGLSFGAVAATVQGEPILVLPGRFPWYRDLRKGDAGPDVLQLNGALLGQSSPTVSAATLGAYARATGAARKIKVIRRCSLFALPPDSRRIQVSGQVGAPAGKLKIRFTHGDPYLRVVLPGDGVDRVRRGTAFAGSGARGTVTRLRRSRSRGLVTAEIRLTRLPRRPASRLGGRLLVAAGAVRPIVVPASAVYEAPQGGSYVMKLVGGERIERVDVRPLESEAGLVALMPAARTRLRTGDRVLVGPYAG